VPEGISLEDAATIPSSFATACNTISADLELPIKWPKPEEVPTHSEDAILIWGASTSAGIEMIQVLTYYGYRNILATSSKTHHSYLQSLGAKHVFDYRDKNTVENILSTVQHSDQSKPAIPFIVDCIGSKDTTIAPISKIAQNGTRVAVLLPVIIKDATETQAPDYAMDPATEAAWANGVIAKGVRTHAYLNVSFPPGYLADLSKSL
jgi:NADPH:quinone reductase-like Zn-dependent oxidoreductase